MNQFNLVTWGPFGCFGRGLGWGDTLPSVVVGSSVFSGFGVPYGIGHHPGGIGTYYNVGAGPSGGGFCRAPWGGGVFSWNPIARGMAGVAGLADALNADNPDYVRSVFDGREAAYRAWQAEEDARRGERAGETGMSEAPANLTDRANDYFGAMVEDGKEPKDVYNSEGRRQVGEREKAEGEEKPEVKGREEVLIGFTKRVAGWMNGDNAAVKRGEFLAQVDAWGGEIDLEKKLLALVAPGAETPADIPNATLQKLLGELGENRTPDDANAENVFHAYLEMLAARFGGDFEGVIDLYFARAVETASGRDNVAISPVTVADIQTKGYGDGSQAIFDKAFADKTPLDARRLFATLPHVSGSPDEKMQEFAKWYLPKIKNINGDEINTAYNYALKKGGLKDGTYNIPIFMDKVDEWISKGKPADSEGAETPKHAPPAHKSGKKQQPRAQQQLTKEQQVAGVEQIVDGINTQNGREIISYNKESGTITINVPEEDLGADNYKTLEDLLAKYPEAVTAITFSQ